MARPPEKPRERPRKIGWLAAWRGGYLRYPTVVALIVANLVPLFGVLFWGWDLFVLMMAFFTYHELHKDSQAEIDRRIADAPFGTASNPVPVRRPAASLHASFPRSVTLAQLRFASLSMA